MNAVTLTPIRSKEAVDHLKRVHGISGDINTEYQLSIRNNSCTDYFTKRGYATYKNDAILAQIFIGFTFKEISLNPKWSIDQFFPEYAKFLRYFKYEVGRDYVKGRNNNHTMFAFKLLRIIIKTRSEVNVNSSIKISIGDELCQLTNKLIEEDKIPVYKAFLFAFLSFVNPEKNRLHDRNLIQLLTSTSSILFSSTIHNYVMFPSEMRLYNGKLKSFINSQIKVYKLNDFLKACELYRTYQPACCITGSASFESFEHLNIPQTRISLRDAPYLTKEAFELILKGEFKKANKIAKCQTLKV